MVSIGKPTNETHFSGDHERIGEVFGEKPLGLFFNMNKVNHQALITLNFCQVMDYAPLYQVMKKQFMKLHGNDASVLLLLPQSMLVSYFPVI